MRRGGGHCFVVRPSPYFHVKNVFYGKFNENTLARPHARTYIIFSPEPPEPSTQCPSNTLRFASFYPRCFAVNDYLVTSFFSLFPSFLSVSSIPSLMKMLHSNLQPCCGPRLFDHYTILSLALRWSPLSSGCRPKIHISYLGVNGMKTRRNVAKTTLQVILGGAGSIPKN